MLVCNGRNLFLFPVEAKMRASGLAQAALDTPEKLEQPRIYPVVAKDTAWGAPDTPVER